MSYVYTFLAGMFASLVFVKLARDNFDGAFWCATMLVICIVVARTYWNEAR